MNKVASLIISKRRIILTLILIITIISAVLIPSVSVNYDVSKYLPKNSNTTKGLDIMKSEFGLIGSVDVMAKNVTTSDAMDIYNALLNIEDIKAVEFDITSNDYYKNNKALYLVTINNDDYSKTAINTVKTIKDSLKNYDISVGGRAVDANYMSSSLKDEVPYFAIIAVSLIFIILLLISTSWIEPILFLSISGISIIINYGTNIILGEVSFVTFSIAALLQLALSMDYSIMLLDQYHHEIKDNKKDIAMKKAFVKAFKAVLSSSLTTIFGLLTMLFISFGIGKDLGLVLSKGILINVLVVFIVLPGLILIFDKLLEKTKKKSIRIPIGFFSNLGIKGKYIITILMIIVVIGSYIIQTNLKLEYSYNLVNKETKEINNEFGKNNQMVLLYKSNTDENKIYNVLGFLQNYKVNNKNILNKVIDYHNTVAIKLTSKEISLMSNIDENIVNGIYTMYNYNTGNTNDKIALNNFIDFILKYVAINPEYNKYFTKDVINKLNATSIELQKSEELLKSNNYNRMIIRTNMDYESENTYKFFNELNKLSKDNLNEFYILGETPTAFDIKGSFGSELLLITILTIISMLLIIGITYRSISIPVILVSLIQGAIWISMCIPVISNNSLYFLAFIIVQCIQMGATIDYAILLSSNYLNNRKKYDKKESLNNALKSSISTIFTSASILIVATFVIAIVSSQDMISTICTVIGRGTIVSTIVVLLILPAYLILFDRFIEKTTYKTKFNK